MRPTIGSPSTRMSVYSGPSPRIWRPDPWSVLIERPGWLASRSVTRAAPCDSISRCLITDTGTATSSARRAARVAVTTTGSMSICQRESAAVVSATTRYVGSWAAAEVPISRKISARPVAWRSVISLYPYLD